MNDDQDSLRVVLPQYPCSCCVSCCTVLLNQSQLLAASEPNNSQITNSADYDRIANYLQLVQHLLIDHIKQISQTICPNEYLDRYGFCVTLQSI